MIIKKNIEIDRDITEFLLMYFKEGIVGIDLETTGLSPLLDSVIEVSAIKITPRGIEVFETLINPQIEIPPLSTSIHGISDNDVQDSPIFRDVLPKLMSFVDDLPIVAHNAQFDLGFLINGMHLYNIPFKNKTRPGANNNLSDIYCSIRLSRKIFKELGSYRLSDLTESLNIPMENKHRAYDDALACLKVLGKCLGRLNTLELTQKQKNGMLSDANIFNLKDFLKMEDFVFPEKLKLLKAALSSQIEVFIKYMGGSKKNQFRLIKPVSVLPLPQGVVLYALCKESNLYKYYFLEKISEVKETKR
jgi:DNA polymerase-3 subunit epsilon